MKGTLNLKFNDQLIDTREYKSAAGIDRIVAGWAKMYGVGMKKAVVEVIPGDEPYQRHFKRGDEKMTRRLSKMRSAKYNRNWGS